MVFNAIAVWLLIASVPLWICRWFLFSRLTARERLMFKRLVAQRHESAFMFAARMAGYLIVLAFCVFVVVFGLRYLKNGNLGITTYSDIIRSRFYSGIDPLDHMIDSYHYDQMLPVAVLTTILFLTVSFTLATAALRDISLIRRMQKKVRKVTSRA
ncbi:hypothetical protein SIAM614_20346 [Stappia aggregata IAM 12614]|uniref:Uncharacterized protein n=1 Tax=Roseibium aggregatum (strain ATCC 25650 / DSM 13394 / JCM 20685 / NBRC 16684 / NCIMB 2208 / IAM 12614 / B1) TaxID=384765 RepID=A0NW46_ROSAI|nr:hypothetical protein [Roseibium aggregatum]EAV43211.1 hypothetical protein SIAM614_20346 [Stappia aggregata IAM 12614] [Roseibium aggregatum IAM 12614]